MVVVGSMSVFEYVSNMVRSAARIGLIAGALTASISAYPASAEAQTTTRIRIGPYRAITRTDAQQRLSISTGRVGEGYKNECINCKVKGLFNNELPRRAREVRNQHRNRPGFFDYSSR